MKSIKKNIDRQPAVAGKFYPADPSDLGKMLDNLFGEASAKECEHVRAIISPHAGYVFSGKTAASAFNQIEGEVTYKRIFLLASSHHVSFDGASVYCEGDFVMPYGKEIVDTIFGEMLTERFPAVFTNNPTAHVNEHSIEVQLPFLHHVMKTRYRIVPIIIGTSNPETCKRIAAILKPYFNPNNMFVISTDFSHYPAYSDAMRVDEQTQKAILCNDPDILMATLRDNSRKHIPNLATSLCGWTSVLTLLYMTTHNDALELKSINYTNSGDAKYYGEKSQVVGYWAMVVTDKKTEKSEFKLSESEKTTLLKIARKTIEEHLKGKNPETEEESDLPPSLKEYCGAFVTLHEKGQLRGCIGKLISNSPLHETIRDMAISSAFHDYRFMPLNAHELPHIDIEISVLSPLKKIDDIKEIQMGRHGILIEKGHRSGVFLPQVATETGWNKEEFLGHCARDKAGLEWDGWKSANIYIFTATVFGEKLI
ncbi:MAG: AmmeMemoRadiSam system protein B [Bacteroidota bacterium]|nr:AmmeMemoRadiSam system protein B [Bacteroidota bacterium]